MKNQQVKMVSTPSAAPAPPPVRYRTVQTRDWTLNLRLLFWTAAVVGVMAPTLYGLRGFQVRRNAVALFDRAQTLEQQGELAAAADNLFRYLKFNPDDGLARVLLAEVFDKTAVSLAAKERATEHYYTALAHFPERNDLRTRLAEILLEIDQPGEAEEEALRVLFGDRNLPRAEVLENLKRFQDRFERASLVRINGSAPAALKVLATAAFEKTAERRDRPVNELLLIMQSALAVNRDNIELSLLLARVYRELALDLTPEERAEKADDVVDTMAAGHADVAKAHLALYRYRKEHGLPAADEALSTALAAAPDNFETVLTVASDALMADDLDKAETYFTKAISLPDADPRAYAGLAQLRLRQGQMDASIVACEDGLAKFGVDEINLQVIRLQATIQNQQLQRAEELLTKVIRPVQEQIAPLLRLRDRTRLRDQISMLEADLAVAERKLLRAAAILRQLTVPRSAEQRLEVDLRERARRWSRLGQVYQDLRYWELAAKAYEQQAALQDNNYSAHLAAGVTWRAGGRLDAAIQSIQTALSAPDAQAEGWLLLTRAELERQTRRSNRDWTRVDQSLSEAEKLLGDTPAVALLKIEVLHAKGDNAAALEALAEKSTSHPKQILPFAVLFYQQIGQSEYANQSLGEFAQMASIDAREVQLLELELRRRQKKYDECERILRDLLANAEPSQRYGLIRQRALIGVERGFEKADELLLEMQKEFPEDPWALEQLAELAFSKHDYKRLADYERLLEQLEGNEGTYWRFYRGMRLIAESSDVKDTRFQQAVRLHSELQSLRPAWPRALQLKGRLAQQMGKVEEAAEAYKSAIEAGAASVTVFEGLVTLLYANNRWSEADAFLEQLQQVGYESPVLESLSARVLLRQGEFQQAVSAARSGAALRPRDPLAHVWLGQTLTLAANRELDAKSRQPLLVEAKAAFEKAVTIAPEDFRAWSGLLWYCVRAGDRDAGQRALEGLRSQARMPETQRMLALGQAHQLLGQYALAEEQFLGAVKLLPNDAGTQERLAQFYLAYAPEKAHQALRRLLDLDPKSATARRALAMLMVSQGGDAELAEAVKLLRSSGEQSADRRLEAVLLMQRGGKENLESARKLFEGLIRESTGDNATDRHLLAIVAEAQGDIGEARRLLEQLATEKENAVQWASLAEFFLRHDLSSEATQAVTKLDEASPNSWQTLRIKTKWMKATGQPDAEIEKEIDRYSLEASKAASGDAQKLALVNRLAALLAELGLKAQAEMRYRAFFDQKPTDQVRQAFALWLIKNQQIADAVRLAMEGFEAKSPTAANIQLLSNVLTVGTSNGLRFPEAEAKLEQTMRDQPDNASLLLEFATLRHVQGDMQAATKLYRQVLVAVPNNPYARNNFAVLLLEQPDGAREALMQIEDALRMAGPIPELRDTYALALAHNGRPEEACRILRGLLSQSPHNARYLFHLAIASNKAGNEPAAADALTKAIANKLEGELLTPTERRQILELQKSLGTSLSASADVSH